MKTEVAEKDSADLERLEAIVNAHRKLKTAELSAKSGISPERIRALLTNHSFRVREIVDKDSTAGIPASLWVWKPTLKDIARPHRAKRK